MRLLHLFPLVLAASPALADPSSVSALVCQPIANTMATSYRDSIVFDGGGVLFPAPHTFSAGTFPVLTCPVPRAGPFTGVRLYFTPENNGYSKILNCSATLIHANTAVERKVYPLQHPGPGTAMIELGPFTQPQADDDHLIVSCGMWGIKLHSLALY